MNDELFFKNLESGLKLLANLNGQPIIKDGKITQEILVDLGRVSKSEKEARNEYNYIEKLKANSEIREDEIEIIDNVLRDIIDTKMWNKLKG